MNAPFGVEHVREACRTILLPEDVDPADLEWGFRLNRPDLVSTHDFRWPFPGAWATAPGPIKDHTDDCCHEIGDGICAALSLEGASSNGARLGDTVGLLVAWTAPDVLGRSADKVRLRRAWVGELFDPISAVNGAKGAKANLTGANLTGANLTGANLTGANLTRANLTRADLAGAYLTRANLTGANLTGAYLSEAYLSEANLTEANLTEANLTGANLTRANLTRANLTRANLTRAYLSDADLAGAYLSEANLTGANLTRANLTRAYLSDADLAGALYSQVTRWPAGFDATTASAVLV